MEGFFDKYEQYADGNSLYCYPDSCVLINNLDLRDGKKLREIENIISYSALAELQLHPIYGTFDRAHLCGIHKFLFGELYPFAGETRKENVSKGNVMFCVHLYVDKQLDALFKNAYAQKPPKGCTTSEASAHLAYVFAELNVIHPFREGNGRTIREFIREYAFELGYKLEWGCVDRQELNEAVIESVINIKHLEACIERALKNCGKDF